MNILMINQGWLASDLKSLGHDVITVGHGDNFDLRLYKPVTPFREILDLVPRQRYPDLIFILDNSSPLTLTGFSDVQIPIVFISVDTFHHLDLHSAIGRLCDITFVAQKSFARQMQEAGVHAAWLPLWFSHPVDGTQERNGKAAFVGTLDPSLNPRRVKFFENLQKEVEIDVFSGNWTEHVPKYDLIVNQSVQDDLNFRVFETMGARTLLLTEESENGLREIFTVGKHLLTYEPDNVLQAAQIIRERLADLEGTRRIAKAGYDEVCAKHLPKHRLETIFATLEQTSRIECSQTNFIDVKNLDHLSYLWEAANDNNSVKITLHYALEAFERAMEKEEGVSQNLAAHATLAALRYDRITTEKRGEVLLGRAETHYPGFIEFSKLGIEGIMEASARRNAIKDDLKKSLGF